VEVDNNKNRDIGVGTIRSGRAAYTALAILEGRLEAGRNYPAGLEHEQTSFACLASLLFQRACAIMATGIVRHMLLI
jgi:hypothetical protein